jgi:hypothetical protein
MPRVTFKTSCKAVSLRQHSESGAGDRAQSPGFSMSPCRVITDNEALCTHYLCREVSAVISTELYSKCFQHIWKRYQPLL